MASAPRSSIASQSYMQKRNRTELHIACRLIKDSLLLGRTCGELP